MVPLCVYIFADGHPATRNQCQGYSESHRRFVADPSDLTPDNEYEPADTALLNVLLNRSRTAADFVIAQTAPT